MYLKGSEPLEWLSDFESPVVRLWGKIPLPKYHLIHSCAVVPQDEILSNSSSPAATVWSSPLDAERAVTKGLKCGTMIEDVPTTENPQDVFFCEPFLDIYPDDSQLTTNEIAETYLVAQTSDEHCKTESDGDLETFAPSMWFPGVDDLLSNSMRNIPLPEKQGVMTQPNTEYEGNPASQPTWPKARLTPATMRTKSSSSSSQRKRDDSANVSTHEYNHIIPDNLSHQSLPVFSAQHPACTATPSADGAGASFSPKAVAPPDLSQPALSGPSRIKRRRMPFTDPWLATNRSSINPLTVSSASTAAPAFSMGLMEFTIDFSYTNNTPADEARFLKQYNRARSRNMKAGAREGRGRGLQRRLSLIS